MYARDVTAGDHPTWFYIENYFFTKYHFGILCCVQCELLQE